MKIKNFAQFMIRESVSNYYLPTYEECREICDANDNFLFFESKQELDGYDISIFNYRLATPQNFKNPILDKNISANELRGLTFVFDNDGKVWKRFLLLDKFWNMNQSECSMYSVVKNYKIKNIYSKEDGSIASFIQLPNGKVYGRSKTSFISDQATEIQKIYDNWPNIQTFVNWCMNNDIVPIFEYVAPTNRIVVPYANTDLILLRMRDNATGEYLDIDNYVDKLDGISIAENIKGLTLDDLVELKSVESGKEGWIVQFENGKMIKIKTEWYSRLHGLFTMELERENTLIALIINETIDDVLSQLGETETKKREEVQKITDVINNFIKNKSEEIDELMKEFKGDVRDFAIKNKKNPNFKFCMDIINKGEDKIKLIKDFILIQTKNLMAARQWLKENSL
jgi:T4 RnlA family RNA ligase